MKTINTIFLTICLLLTACNPQNDSKSNKDRMDDWKTTLTQQMPLLGHRNWIVVTDMAYPLQTNPGITTLYANASYHEVIETVDSLIKEAPHVFAHIYQDQEQLALSENLASGWDAYKAGLDSVLDLSKVQRLPHEDIIVRLDEISRLYRVVIIKTPLTIPYTSTFFELDCGYWDAEREMAIRKTE